jgi:ADP-heptose:LPS heptosyltransferase
MTPESFEAIKAYIRSQGMDVVLLGRRDHELTIGATGEKVKPVFDGLDTDDCIDMIDKTTITESLAILAEAHCFIGVDGGLMHLAGLTDIPIVAGFTTVDPWYREIHRHGIRAWNFLSVTPDSECRYCQTDHFCVTGVLFDKCLTKTFECQNSLTADKWIRQIERIL